MSNKINIKRNKDFFRFLINISKRKSVNPLFSNIKVTFDANKTTWFACDGEVSYFFTEDFVEDSTTSNTKRLLGSCVFNGNLFWNFLKKVKSEEIECEWNGVFLNISDGKNKIGFKLATQEFESGVITKENKLIKIQSAKYTRNFHLVTEINTADMKKVIENGLLAVNDESAGVLSLIIKNHTLSFIARDDRRLCVASIPVSYSNDNMSITITTRKIIMEKALEFATQYDKIGIYSSDSEYMIHNDCEYLIFKKLEPDKLNYAGLCNHSNSLAYTCRIAELKEAVEFVTIMCSKLNHTAQLNFNGAELVLQVIDPNQGKCTREIIGEGDITGSICLNAQYLLDALMLKNAEYITIYYKSRERECVLTNGIVTHVIMPIVI